MSFFGGGNNNGPSVNDGAVKQAKIETEVLTDMFNKMTGSCYKKCIATYHDGELNVAELSCLDRCASKYLQAQEKVGQVLHQFEQQMLQQQGMVPPGQQGPGR